MMSWIMSWQLTSCFGQPSEIPIYYKYMNMALNRFMISPLSLQTPKPLKTTNPLITLMHLDL